MQLNLFIYKYLTLDTSLYICAVAISYMSLYLFCTLTVYYRENRAIKVISAYG